MLRICVLFLVTFAAFALSPSARASGDIGCTPSWKLDHTELTGCDNLAIFSPGNDTRVNLAILMNDLQGRKGQAKASPLPPGSKAEPLFDWRVYRDTLFARPRTAEEAGGYSEGEGSRCLSDSSGTAAFEAAVNAAKKLSAAEKTALVTARKGVRSNCSAVTSAPTIGSEVKSAGAREFAAYIEGAHAFYDGDYDTAAARFGALRKSAQPWLRETALYMVGRVEVNRAQIGAFDEYGYYNGSGKVDARTIAAADAAFRAYLRAYPKGLYTASARGLIRRAYWLGGNVDRLAAEYRLLLAEPDEAARGISNADLADEIDNKLIPLLTPTNTTDPVFLAVYDLMRMRHADDGSQSGSSPVLTRAELEAQRPRFASEPQLFETLLAAHSYYVANRPDDVLRLLPALKTQGAVGFSRQALRAMALEKTRAADVRAVWSGLLGEADAPYPRLALELALALHDERHKGLERIFAPGSPIANPSVREILLMNVAGPDLLRRQARDPKAPKHERDVALFTLLYKGVTRGAYKDFIADLALVPPGAPADTWYYDLVMTENVPVGIFTKKAGDGGYPCPSLRDTAAKLAAAPRDPVQLICLAEFMRGNGFDMIPLDTQPPKDELGGTPSLFPGAPFSRLELYKGVMADPKAAANEKAYALYRAIRCYAPSGSNTCGGTEVPTATRRAWYNRLKAEYPTTPWAKELKYYW